MLPSVSIIIPFREKDELLNRAVRSCLDLDYPSQKKEIVLAFNGTGAIPEIDEYGQEHNIKVVHCSQQNPYMARNAAASAASGEILLFTDSDCAVASCWAKELAVSLNRADACAVFGRVKAYMPEKPIEYFADDNVFQQSTMPFEYLLAGNCAIKKDVFEDVGGFDSSFFSCGDIDLSMTLEKNAHNIEYNPKAVVFHKHRENIAGLFLQYLKYGAGWADLKKKWGRNIKVYPVFRRILIAPLFLIGSVCGIIISLAPGLNAPEKAARRRLLYLAAVNTALALGYITGSLVRRTDNV